MIIAEANDLCVPEEIFDLTEEPAEVSAVECEMTEVISPAPLKATRQSLRERAPPLTASENSALLLSAAVDEYCRT